MRSVERCLLRRSRRYLSNETWIAKFGVDTAENELLKVHLIFQPWDLIFTEPPRPEVKLAGGTEKGNEAIRVLRTAASGAETAANLAYEYEALLAAPPSSGSFGLGVDYFSNTFCKNYPRF